MINFSAGPARLPASVLAQAQAELTSYRGSGMSIMEVSHRGPLFQDVIDRAEASLRQLMGIPDTYAVLFIQGGATQQFSMVPLNLLRAGRRAAYLDTGVWSQKAIEEARRYGDVTVVASGKAADYTEIPDLTQVSWPQDAAYAHITTNNTIYGTRLTTLPAVGPVPLVADMSSNILDEPYEVSQFGLIYAGAQKNMGPSGVTVVIIRRDLIGHAQPGTPLVLDYQPYAAHGSMYNTPPTFAIYLAGLVFDWALALGGIPATHALNSQKATLLYDYLDRSSLFVPNIPAPHRSRMNVTFRLRRPELEATFVAASQAAGFEGLKGHRSAGGMRASLYNAVTLADVEALVGFMTEFEHRYTA
ncbi:MAG: 3-phosphoserine/phosphohydroxythreonine transaminase [Bacteroidia bacterium]|nr:3-phosphoserine/phosphohydroxythreonine transaminase [Bacteroidia bacterium]